MDKMLALQDAKRAARDYREDKERLAHTQANMSVAVKRARTDGASWRELADATGLSRERVRHIAG